MQSQTTPDMWGTLWILLEPALTPALVAGVIVTLAGTWFVKTVAPLLAPEVGRSPEIWFAFKATASLGIGALAGFAVWVGTDTGWFAVPIVALCSGPSWRVARAILPRKIGEALRTELDRKHGKKQGSG